MYLWKWKVIGSFIKHTPQIWVSRILYQLSCQGSPLLTILKEIYTHNKILTFSRLEFCIWMGNSQRSWVVFSKGYTVQYGSRIWLLKLNYNLHVSSSFIPVMLQVLSCPIWVVATPLDRAELRRTFFSLQKALLVSTLDNHCHHFPSMYKCLLKVRWGTHLNFPSSALP